MLDRYSLFGYLQEHKLLPSVQFDGDCAECSVGYLGGGRP
jgi:hypothetical protein